MRLVSFYHFAVVAFPTGCICALSHEGPKSKAVSPLPFYCVYLDKSCLGPTLQQEEVVGAYTPGVMMRLSTRCSTLTLRTTLYSLCCPSVGLVLDYTGYLLVEGLRSTSR